MIILSPRRLARNPSFAGCGELEQEDDKEFAYPSALRRFVFFVIWYFIALFGVFFITFVILSIVVGSERADQIVESSDKVGEIFGLLLLIVVASLAVKGHLPGAKKTLKFPESSL